MAGNEDYKDKVDIYIFIIEDVKTVVFEVAANKY